jgi:two-component system LytT family sensor kinase
MIGVPSRPGLSGGAFTKFLLVGWGCFYLLVLAAAAPEIKRVGQIWDQSIDVVAMFVASCLLLPICRYLLRYRLSWGGLEARAFGLSLIVGLAAASIIDFTVFGMPRLTLWLIDVLDYSTVLFLWCSLYFSVTYWQRAAAEREDLLRAQSEARAARLDALRYQLNPHFLFNALNAVSTLVAEGDAKGANRMLAQIADFLRTMLDDDAAAELPLAREITFTRQYLAIEQTRLGQRLDIDYRIAPDTLDALVPVMMLQPLVENAVRHGIAPLVEGGTILIAAERTGARLRLRIENPGRPTAEAVAESGIGLGNTRARLQALYGPDHDFQIERPPAGGCIVALDLPLRLAVGIAACAS